MLINCWSSVQMLTISLIQDAINQCLRFLSFIQSRQPDFGIPRVIDDTFLNGNQGEKYAEPPPEEDENNRAILYNFDVPNYNLKINANAVPPHQPAFLKLPDISIEEIRGPANADARDPDLAKKRAKIKEVSKLDIGLFNSKNSNEETIAS